MLLRYALVPFVLMLAPIGQATAQGYYCAGALPGWTLTMDETAGTLTTNRDVTMQIMDEAVADGPRDWPRALTLVGDRDTAIVLIENEACTVNHTDFPMQAQILTQRGTVPILLTGCCEPRP